MHMPFGIKSAQETFQKLLSQLLGDLPGVETDIDDILIFGRSKEEHDKQLYAMLKRYGEINLTLNKEKCQLGVSEVTYIGHTLNAKGIQLDIMKVYKAIQNMPAPKDKQGVERLRIRYRKLSYLSPSQSGIYSKQMFYSSETLNRSKPSNQLIKNLSTESGNQSS